MSTLKNLKIVAVDYENIRHAADLLLMMDTYASDIMGGGKPLSVEVRAQLVPELGKLKHAFSFLGYVDAEVVALANCFYSFSTFKCKPIVNIHDFVVLDTHRGRGVSQALLMHIQAVAKQNHCCKLTLEVLSNNLSAQRAYKKFGFAAYELHASSGSALFWEKEI